MRRNAQMQGRELPMLARECTSIGGVMGGVMGEVMGAAGAGRFHFCRPPDVESGEWGPLMVMLHGCCQVAGNFSISTCMNRVARREGIVVLYP